MAKLNVGCGGKITGRYKEEEWVNTDPYTAAGRDEDPLKGMTFEDGHFDEIHCVHVLEHIERRDHQPFLEELHRVLAPGGTIYIEVPDFTLICFRISQCGDDDAAGKEVLRCWTLSIYGKGRYEGDAHRWGFSDNGLWNTIEEAGFINLEGWSSEPDSDMMISSHYKQEPVLLMRGSK